jgi:hypothetical protein
MRFHKNQGCPTCGRAGGEKGNLVTTFDLFTQSIYLTEDGYCFQNPYWHKRMVPDPQGYLDLRNLLNKPGKPNELGEMKLVEVLEPETTIDFSLQKFKFLWVFTNRILCILPYEYRDWFKEATFFLRPSNEDLPYFGWLKSAIESRWTRSGYKLDSSTGVLEWKKEENPTSAPLEKPSEFELKFLRRVDELVRKYLAEYTYQPEKLRFGEGKVYSADYLEKIKKVVDEFNHEGSNKWPEDSFNIVEYPDMRLIAFNEFRKLADHVERKLDPTRKGYELYVPLHFEKVNELRMIITVKRDYVSEWYPRAFALRGLWQFQKRPLTKEMIEKWEEHTYSDSSKKSTPLQTCIFCPSDAGSPSSRSDDFAFDSKVLIGSSKNNAKAYLEGSFARLKLEDLNEFCEWLEETLASVSESRELRDDDLNNLVNDLKKAADNREFSSYESRLRSLVSKIEDEKRRRG